MAAASVRVRGRVVGRSQARSRAVAAGSVNGRADGRHGGQVVEVQRARLLVAAVRAVDGIGYADTTVAHITGRARVSRRTFYELFENREECLAAAFEAAVGRIRAELEQGGLAGLSWRERMRAGLWRILCFLDREPVLARFCVVQSARGGSRMLDLRERYLGELVCAIDHGRGESVRAGDCPRLTAEGLVGAALSIVYARLLRGDNRALTGLQGELMGMIVLPYLGSAAARREQARPVPALPAQDGSASGLLDAGDDPLQGVAMRFTYRTARVLEAVALTPGASNRMVGEHAGISDQGQISKLLTRLERLELLRNMGVGHAKGEPNAWRLTATGERVAQRIGLYTEGFQSYATGGTD